MQYFSKCVLCSGDMYEVGAESGRYYCLNVPLRDGIDDQSEFLSTHTMMSSIQEPRAANHGKVNGNKAVVFRLPPALPASDQTGGGFLPAHMHRPAGQCSLRVPLGMDGWQQARSCQECFSSHSAALTLWVAIDWAASTSASEDTGQTWLPSIYTHSSSQTAI